ncbi:glycine receptor subunit alpha-2-like [Haliotis cracherodii]|uniref:glycine receptor subunit alpha-2-like n=1 Tax=Haliotis cracherodii TaxID=6455 RepID=UPI0039E81245
MARMGGTLVLFCYYLITVAFSAPEIGNSSWKMERDLINRLLDSSRYDASIQPSSISGIPTKVEIDLVLNSVGPVNDIDMVFRASFFLRQQWVDPRLKFNEVNHSIVLSEKRLSRMWVPDIFFPESTEETRHIITTPNVLIRLHPDGSILYSQRLSVTMQCRMDLSKFPLDRQECGIKMESYGYTTDDVYFTWSSERKSTSVMPNAYIPDFTLTNVTAHDCTAKYETGSFTCIQARLGLKREIGFYATQTYIPSILIVVLSWASFWIDHEAVPARISVGLLTVLTITTQSSGARAQLPRVPYVKAIDVWMSACLVFVFAAYMEYAVVTVLSRSYRKQKARQELKKNSKSTMATVSDVDVTITDQAKKPKDKDTGRFVDKLSRFIFPLAFLIFNFGYWIWYIHIA